MLKHAFTGQNTQQLFYKKLKSKLGSLVKRSCEFHKWERSSKFWILQSKTSEMVAGIYK